MKSKRLLDISTRLPKAPTFFLDRTFGSDLLASELQSWKWDVEVHRAKYGDKRSVGDDRWIVEVGEKNWRILTADKDLEYRHHEAIVRANAGIFIVSDLKDGEGYLGWVRMLTKCKRRLVHDSHFAPRPFVARISRDGNVYKISHLLPRGMIRDVTHSVLKSAELYSC